MSESQAAKNEEEMGAGAPVDKKETRKRSRRDKEEPAAEGGQNDTVASTEGKIADAEARISAAEAKLADAESRSAELNERLMRTAAEYENHRKRSARETESAFKNGVCFSAEELLPVLDTLNAAASVPTTDEEYKKGVILTLAKCEEVFEKLGITEIKAEGQPFDPELHNAVMQKAVDGVASGMVSIVMQKGYKLGDRVIRHAMVAVAP